VILKEYTETAYTGEMTTACRYSMCFDGTYYIIAYVTGGNLYVKYSTTRDTIKTSGTQAFTDYVGDHWGSSDSSYYVLRAQENTIYLAYWADEGSDINTVYWGYTTDITAGFTMDNATSGELFEKNDALLVYCAIGDVFNLGSSTVYVALALNAPSNWGVGFYELNGYTEVASDLPTGTETATWWCPGYFSDDGSKYYFGFDDAPHPDYKVDLYSFDGSASLIDENEIIANAQSIRYAQSANQSLMRKNGWRYFLGSTKVWVNYNNTGWREVTSADEWTGIKVAWSEEADLINPEPQWILPGRNVDLLYHVLPSGYPVLIKELSSTGNTVGIGNVLSPFEFEGTTVSNISRPIFSHSRGTSRGKGYEKLNFNTTDSTIVQGKNLLYLDVSEDVTFAGNVFNISQGKDFNAVEAHSFAKYDLINNVSVSLVQTFKEILEEAIPQLLFFSNDGTGIDDPTGNITNVTDTVFIGNFGKLTSFLERDKIKIIYHTPNGKIWADDADVTQGITATEAETLIRPGGIQYQGEKINAILVEGGVKTDGSVASYLLQKPSTTDQSINLMKVIEEDLVDDSLGGEMHDFASRLLTNVAQSYKYTKALVPNKKKPQLSRQIKINSPLWGVTDELNIVDNYIFDGDTDYCDYGLYNHYFIKSAYGDDLPESNRNMIKKMGGTIAINVSDIATNVGGIAINVSDIATNVSNITTNTTSTLHKGVANEFTGITVKTTLADADEFILEDSAASFIKKAVTYANIKAGVTVTPGGIGTIIHPMTFGGGAGFVLASRYGSAYSVLLTDLNAYVNASFHVEAAGTYDVHIWASQNSGAGRTASGIYHISTEKTLAWDISAVNYDIAMSISDYAFDRTIKSSLSISAGSRVGVQWTKDNDPGTGTMYVWGIYLERVA